MWSQPVLQSFYPRYVDQNADVLEKIWESDSDVQDFCNSVQNRKHDTVSAFRNQAEKNRGISVKILEKAITGLWETESGIVKIILQQKKRDWKNPYLVELVRAFISTVTATSEFCDAIQLSIRRATENLKFVLKAVNSVCPGGLPTKCKARSIFGQLQKFRKAETPFTEDFKKSFRAVQIEHENLLKMFNEMKIKRIGKAKFWRKVTSVIFVAAIAGVVICAVVGAAIVAPPAAVGALSAATSFPASAISSWVQNLFKIYDEEIKAQPELVPDMPVNNHIPIEELNNIESLVDNIQNQVGSNVMCFWLKWLDRKALQLALDDLKGASNKFIADLEKLEKHVREVHERTLRAREEVSDRISKHMKRK